MSNDALKTFSEELKTHREENNITLQQIHNRTKIDIKFLRSIEEGNFHVMPEVYIRAFIREYAKAIGLDGNVVLKNYEKAKAGMEVSDDELEAKEEAKPLKREFDASTEKPLDITGKRSLNLNFIFGASFLLIVALVFIYIIFFNSKEDVIVREIPYEEILNQNEDTLVAADEKTENKISAVSEIPVDSLKLNIFSSDTCWVGVTIDKQSSTDFILYPGNSKTVKALTYFNLVLGNSAGVKLTLNGKELEITGKKGGRKVLRISKDGIIK